MIEAVIFDMDGVLLDSEPFWREAEKKVFAKVGITMTDAMCRETMGIRINEAVEYWYRKRPWTGLTQDAVAKEIVETVRQRIAERGALMHGAAAMIQFFRKRSLKMAVASSSAFCLIHTAVDTLGIRKYFDAIHSAEHERYGKPHPVVYLTAAERLSADPLRCLAVEDSLNGVIAAKAARMKVVAVPDAEHQTDTRFAIADILLPSLAAFDETHWNHLNTLF